MDLRIISEPTVTERDKKKMMRPKVVLENVYDLKVDRRETKKTTHLSRPYD